MRTFLFISIFIITYITSPAQTTALGCGNGRYVNDVFPLVTKTSNITFGNNTVTDYSTGATYNQTLQMDFYEPAGDVAIKRPLMILAFGGGFISGQRSDLEPICIAFAKKGYTAAAIDYRLVYNSPTNYYTVFNSPSLLVDEVIKAAADMKAAIRYFKRDARTTNLFRIDTTKIIIGGASSGSITAMTVGYTDDINENPAATSAYNNNGGFEGNTDLPAPNNLRPTYNATGIAGVINISGGVMDTSLVDAFNPPIYSAHGDADNVVPYNYGAMTYSGNPLPINIYGSNLIRVRANNIGLRNVLYTVPNGNHESTGTEPYISQIVAGIATMYESIVCSSSLPLTLTSFTVQRKQCAAMLRWQTASEVQSSHFDIEVSNDATNFSKVATIQTKNSSLGATYSYELQSGKASMWIRLKMVDKDGSSTYSAVHTVKSQCGTVIQVYPNPATSIALVSGLEANMRVEVIDAEGKTLWSQIASGDRMQIPVAILRSGLLLVRVKDRNGDLVASTKLIRK